jgi:hypothetical protein
MTTTTKRPRPTLEMERDLLHQMTKLADRLAELWRNEEIFIADSDATLMQDTLKLKNKYYVERGLIEPVEERKHNV